MTSDIAIELSGISKKYRLFNSRRDRLLEALHPFSKTYHREFWALHDIDLTLRRGRTIGILGMNGSGKSTLLQIVCSILRPTTGTCRVNGRIAALLELGAGFNPELTGRENVVTNALIMGLGRRQIEHQLNDVRSFADIGDYFDQPVKTYSSGMFMRVAFAAAVHVDPDILIIDEALAVGDAKFQEKCFRKFKSFQEAGKTILYVTHDRASVTYLCNEAILLHCGRLVEVGEPKQIVELYTELLTTGRLPSEPLGVLPAGPAAAAGDNAAATGAQSDGAKAGTGGSGEIREVAAFLADSTPEDRCALNPLYNANEQRFGNGRARIVDALVMVGAKANPDQVLSGATVEVYVKVHYESDHDAPIIGFTLTNAQGVVVFGTHSGWLGVLNAPAAWGDVRVYRFRIRLNLCIGPWFVDLAVARSQSEISEVRAKILLLTVTRKRMMVGLVELDTEFAALPEPESAAEGGGPRQRLAGMMAAEVP